MAIYKPFDSKFLNYKEVLNEMLVALAAYPLWLYSDWANNEEDKVFGGWFLISIICAIILLNVILLAGSESRKLCQKIKIWYAKRKKNVNLL